MGEDERRSFCGEDRISGLPDELLHDILVRLRCTCAAARTSMLSRRWRHVWAHLPELRLDQWQRQTSGSGSLFLGTVDAALAGYSAQTLERLSISLSSDSSTLFRASRIAPWLHFAAEHMVGELSLYVPHQWLPYPGFEEVLELPACERAKRIELCFMFAPRLRPQASGMFAALVFLKIYGHVHMEGSDLTALVCTQCPCLRDLILYLKLIAESDVSLNCNSLQTLLLSVSMIRRLEVVAPRLVELTLYKEPMEAHISAPKLAKVDWQAAYDPDANHFVDVSRTLRLLKTSKWASSLINRFDEVDELGLEIDLSFGGVERYTSFLNEINKLPKCKSFSVDLHWKDHALMPIMLHLLKSCNGAKKFTVYLFDAQFRPGKMYPYQWSCLYRSEQSRKIVDIDLSSLEEVEIIDFSYSQEEMELVDFLSYNAGILKRLVIFSVWPSPTPKEVRERVSSICPPNVKVEFGDRGGR